MTVQTLIRRTCPECGVEFETDKSRGKPRTFCCDAHKQAHANRMTVRGKQLARVAMGWRITRGTGDWGKALFAEMTSMLDSWAADDKAANRMRGDDYMKLVANFHNVNPDYNGGRSFEYDRWFDRKN